MSDDATTAIDEKREQLEQERIEVEILKLRAERDKLEIEAEQQRVYLRRQQNNALLDTDTVRIVRVSDAITSGSVDRILQRIDALVRLDPTLPIELIIDCPGGSVISGFELYDRLMEVRSAGTRIDTTVYGFGASMASIISQVGETRRIGANAYLMIHEIATFQFGSVSITEMQDEAELLKRLNVRLFGILEGRAAVAPSEEKLTADVLKKKTARKKDWWVDANEALKYGLVDAIVPSPAVSTLATA